MENNMSNLFAKRENEQSVQTVTSSEKKSKIEQAKENLKIVNEDIASLKSKLKMFVAKKEKSENTKKVLKNLRQKLAELTIKKAELKKIISSAKTNAQIRKSKKYLETAKYEAIKTNLEKNNIYDENTVKTLINIRTILITYNVKGFNQLEQILKYAQQTAPDLFGK